MSADGILIDVEDLRTLIDRRKHASDSCLSLDGDMMCRESERERQ